MKLLLWLPEFTSAPNLTARSWLFGQLPEMTSGSQQRRSDIVVHFNHNPIPSDIGGGHCTSR